MAAREGLEGLRERQLQLPPLEEAAPQQAARRLIPRREARLARCNRLQIGRGDPEVRSELRKAEAGLPQEIL
ncbi:MAG: hypothetical protein EHM71_05950 [Zetaproteobacteria bacterium]|nr:MAG: hypothetical protein EHM71_05950 [Zetaproteobacteria bacterium]